MAEDVYGIYVGAFRRLQGGADEGGLGARTIGLIASPEERAMAIELARHDASRRLPLRSRAELIHDVIKTLARRALGQDALADEAAAGPR